MEEGPNTSVVDIFGRSHECDKLFVIGGGAFPGYYGYNSIHTIQALVYMTADHMLDRSVLTGRALWERPIRQNSGCLGLRTASSGTAAAPASSCEFSSSSRATAGPGQGRGSATVVRAHGFEHAIPHLLEGIARGVD